jgi:class 3 adenylate cyclase
MTATGLGCGSCGTELPPDSRFCNKCGAPITPAATSAEYKQVTVLFADVVRSMDIAALVGAERLREIMVELVERCAAVVLRGAREVGRGDAVTRRAHARCHLLVNAATARSRQAVCRGPLIRLPGGAIACDG